MDVEAVIANAQAEAAERAAIESGHPTQTQLWAYLNGELERSIRGRVGAHLGSCSRCRRELTSLRSALAELDALLPEYLTDPSIVEASATSSADGRARSLMRSLQPIFGPRRWAWHAAAFVVGSTALIGLNGYLHAAFTPEPSPFGTPPSPPWWAEWWTPYAVGAWTALLGLHGWVVWRRRRDDKRSATQPSNRDESGG